MSLLIFFKREDKVIKGPGIRVPGMRGTRFLLPAKTANSLKSQISSFNPGRTMGNTYWG